MIFRSLRTLMTTLGLLLGGSVPAAADTRTVIAFDVSNSRYAHVPKERCRMSDCLLDVSVEHQALMRDVLAVLPDTLCGAASYVQLYAWSSDAYPVTPWLALSSTTDRKAAAAELSVIKMISRGGTYQHVSFAAGSAALQLTSFQAGTFIVVTDDSPRNDDWLLGIDGVAEAETAGFDYHEILITPQTAPYELAARLAALLTEQQLHSYNCLG